jgi:hypothetical protein
LGVHFITHNVWERGGSRIVKEKWEEVIESLDSGSCCYCVLKCNGMARFVSDTGHVDHCAQGIWKRGKIR